MSIFSELVGRARLVGSRGRAILYGRPEPQDVDVDLVIHAETPAELADAIAKIRQLCTESDALSLRIRLTGVTATSPWFDISAYPAGEWPAVLRYWAMREAGVPKEQCSCSIDAFRREWIRTAPPEWLAVLPGREEA